MPAKKRVAATTAKHNFLNMLQELLSLLLHLGQSYSVENQAEVLVRASLMTEVLLYWGTHEAKSLPISTRDLASLVGDLEWVRFQCTRIHLLPESERDGKVMGFPLLESSNDKTILAAFRVARSQMSPAIDRLGHLCFKLASVGNKPSTSPRPAIREKHRSMLAALNEYKTTGHKQTYIDMLVAQKFRVVPRTVRRVRRTGSKNGKRV